MTSDERERSSEPAESRPEFQLITALEKTLAQHWDELWELTTTLASTNGPSLPLPDLSPQELFTNPAILAILAEALPYLPKQVETRTSQNAELPPIIGNGWQVERKIQMARDVMPYIHYSLHMGTTTYSIAIGCNRAQRATIDPTDPTTLGVPRNILQVRNISLERYEGDVKAFTLNVWPDLPRIQTNKNISTYSKAQGIRGELAFYATNLGQAFYRNPAFK